MFSPNLASIKQTLKKLFEKFVFLHSSASKLSRWNVLPGVFVFLNSMIKNQIVSLMKKDVSYQRTKRKFQIFVGEEKKSVSLCLNTWRQRPKRAIVKTQDISICASGCDYCVERAMRGWDRHPAVDTRVISPAVLRAGPTPNR